MELHKIAVRVLFAYVVLNALMRLSGKRVVSEAGARDFVVALIVGDLIDDLMWAEVGAAEFVAASGGIILAGLVVAVVTYANAGAAAALDGRPELVVREGIPVRAGLRAERVNEKSLAALLRLQGIDRERWDEVERAWLERNGQLSVSPREEARAARRGDGRRVLPRVPRGERP